MSAISYSGMSMYQNCPKSFKYKYIDKVEEKCPPTEETAPALYRGKRLHQAAEDYLTGKLERLPKEISFYAQFFTHLRGEGALPEVQWNFTKEWEPIPFDNKEEGFVRGIADIIVPKDDVCYVYELKTGKEYDNHTDQRGLYGLAGLLLYPEAKEVSVTNVYMDLKKNINMVYPRSMLDAYKWMWERKVNATRPPQRYPARPSWKCKFCPYSRRSKGPCPH